MHSAEYEFWIIVIFVCASACVGVLSSWVADWIENRRTRRILNRK